MMFGIILLVVGLLLISYAETSLGIIAERRITTYPYTNIGTIINITAFVTIGIGLLSKK